jgi:NAD(P)-dependent dehydrogenase (short-subunit alcohol dehydrogenase family)
VRNVYPDVAQENIAFVQLDVANEAQAKAAVDEAMKRFGRIDVLVTVPATITASLSFGDIGS